jgi:hypothetical protein
MGKPKYSQPVPSSASYAIASCSDLWTGFRVELSRLSVMGARFEESSNPLALDGCIGDTDRTRPTRDAGNP